MLLLTGATGLVGSRLLRRLTAARKPVRCLVRDPRRLGEERVRVQIALGDLADPPSFRNALRGVTTVVHLAAAIRDQPRGSIEELNGIATWRMVQAAEAAGVRRFIFFSALGATAHDRTRFLRAKALAEEAVLAADLESVIVAPSIIYAPGDLFMHAAVADGAGAGRPDQRPGRARYQPIWAEDVAECVLPLLGAVRARRGPLRAGRPGHAELHGDHRAAAGGRRPPAPAACTSRRRSSPARCAPTEALLKSKAPATWDEAELMEVSMLTSRGTTDAQILGVRPESDAQRP